MIKYSNHTRILALNQFFGQHIAACSDGIDAVASQHGLRSCPNDLQTGVANIDVEDDRLNVGLREGVVIGFSIG